MKDTFIYWRYNNATTQHLNKSYVADVLNTTIKGVQLLILTDLQWNNSDHGTRVLTSEIFIVNIVNTTNNNTLNINIHEKRNDRTRKGNQLF
jgi:hypothetical protein